MLTGSLFRAETRAAVVTPGLPYVYNIVVMGIHVQSMSLARCAVFCWKDKTEFTVQQSAECAHTLSEIYRRMSHARCKTTRFVRGLVSEPAVVSAQAHTTPWAAGQALPHLTDCSRKLHESFEATCLRLPIRSVPGSQVLTSNGIPHAGQVKDKAGPMLPQLGSQLCITQKKHLLPHVSQNGV